MKMFKMTTGGGQALLRSKQSAVKRALLYILTPIFCVALCVGAVFSFSNKDNKVSASAASTVKSAAYLDLNGGAAGTKILYGFDGAQRESVYFGNFEGSLLKWRVLAKNDERYGSGNDLLLFADDLIESYVNYDTSGASAAHYGTSKWRAILNGGYYKSSSGINTLLPQSPYTEILFDGLDVTAVKTVASIATYNFSYQRGDTHPEFKTVGNFLSTSVVAGKFAINSDCAQPQNTKSGIINSPNNNFEVKFNTTDNVKTNGIVEYVYGDKLFLLDYDDIINRDYGFVNAAGQTYIEFLGGTYARDYAAQGASYGLPSGIENDDAPFISDGFAMPTVTSMWLRNFGRRSDQNSAFRGMLENIGNGYIFAGTSRSDKTAGIRPAFVFDATKIAYATAVAPTNAMADMSVVPSKPAYKLYFKDANFVNTSSSAKATVKDNNGTLSISYNNPTTVSNGKLVLLLSDKTKTDGSIAYQTAMSMGVTGSDTTALANVTLPAGVSLSTHNVSLIYTTDNGGNKPENIYCSYTTDSGIDTPQNFDAGKYDNTSKWIGDLQTKPAWWDTNIHGNDVFVTVDSVEYTNAKGELKTDKTYTTADIKDAGTYKVTLKLANGLKWSDNTTANKSFTITIKRADSTVTAEAGKNNLYDTEGLPTNKDGTANVTNTAENGTPGTFAWNANQTPSPGTPEYTCTFTPTDDNNFNTKDDCSVSITFIADEVAGVTASVAVDGTGTDKLYTSNTLEKLKAAPFSLTVKLVYESGLQKATSDYTLSVLKDGSPQDYFHAGTNTVQVESNGYDCSFTVEVIAAEIDSIKSVAFNQNGDKIYPDTPLDDIEKYFTVQAYWNYNTSKFETLDKDNFKLQGTLVPGTGTSTLSIVYTKGGVDVSYPVPVGALNNITVDYLTYDMDGVELTGEKTVTYDGDPHALTLTGDLPDGVTAGNITYTKQGGTPTTTAPTDAGTYTVKVSFTGDTVNYNAINDVTATLTIDKATVTGIVFEDAVKPEITGTTYTLEATGYPSWVNVTYSVTDEENNPLSVTSFSAAGTYKFTATFTIDAAHVNNYEPIAPITKTLTISDKPPVDGVENIVVEATITVTYTGSPVDYSAKKVPDIVTASYKIEKGGAVITGTDIINVGVYTVTVSFATPADKAPIASKTCTVTVKKATVNMDGVEFADRTVTGNGKPHKVEATNLPEGVTVEYEYNGKKQTTPFEFTEVDDYTVKAYFTYEDEDNYEAIEPIEMTLTVSDAVVDSISAKVEDGAKFDINGTLDDVKAKLTATAHFNNGTTEQVKAEDLTITCATLRDGGLLEVGTQTIKVTYNDGTQDFTTTVQIEVARAKVALPVYSGSLRYTGDVLKPAAADFTGFDGALMALVESKTVAGLNVGAYKAVFALKDSERYEWATTTTYKKTVFAAVVYEEVVLEDYEAAVDWNLAKAKITATKANGKLPVFASESYTGSFAEIVGLKYYTDETCAEEIPADELGYSTKYFVKAELIDTANFELDETAMALSKTAFEYTTPEKQLTVWEKIVKFLSVNWLWIVIAVVALILLITLIALAVRAAKRKRIREEQRLAKEERKEEERRLREEERRREEREERMARLSQPQMMMPQMMPQMPQMMQMPQMGGQSMSNGGASSNELAELKAEVSALRAAQESMRAEQTAKELAEIKALHTAEQQVAQAKTDMRVENLTSRLGGEQLMSGGLTAATLAEIVTAAMEKVLDSREKPAAQTAPATPESNAAASVATQVPPDAVMTTVTTTKIDTTKKAAQPAQAAQTSDRATPAGRTIVRNFVAPMPVDDGRVFDVGGFYTPADPVDLGVSDEETDKKD